MKLINFIGKSIHGYLEYNIDFNSEITFLTGINGSGKTTVIRCISALLKPSLIHLATIEYEKIAITILNGNKTIIISAENKESEVEVRVTGIEQTFLFSKFTVNEDYYSRFKYQEKMTDYFKEIELVSGNNEVIKFIKNIPSPVFLGIERKGGDYNQPFVRPRPFHFIRQKNRNYFENFLFDSISEAASLAELHFRKVQASQKELTEKLREKIVLAAFKWTDLSSSNSIPLKHINSSDVEEIKKTIKTTFRQLNIDSKDVEKELDKFLTESKKIINELPATSEELKKLLAGDNPSKNEFLLQWFMNLPQYGRFVSILRDIEEFLVDSKEASLTIDTYKEAVNNFLSDSKKEVDFDEIGNLIVKIPNKEINSITALSSGESQIVVLLTHLAFNPIAKEANIFVVDEPELSLHIRWQEIFVESIMKVNPDLQLILATHSPSIILDNLKYCVDLNRG